MRSRVLLALAAVNVALFVNADTPAGRWVTAGGAIASAAGALAARTRKDTAR